MIFNTIDDDFILLMPPCAMAGERGQPHYLPPLSPILPVACRRFFDVCADIFAATIFNIDISDC